MTALELFSYIMLAVLLQVSLVGGLMFFRHMRSYDHLKTRMAGYEGEQSNEVYAEIASQRKAVKKGGPWKDFRDLKVVRKVYEDTAKTICSFYLTPKDSGGTLPPFMPGQFLTFQLDVQGEPLPIIRCYSLSDSPDQETYRVSIKREMPPKDKPEAKPGLSSNHFHDHVNEGDLLSVKAPSGHFFLEHGTAPIVLIGSGIGITPMLSMLSDSLKRPGEREIWLFYGVRNSNEHIMKDQLEALAEAHPNFHLHVCYSRPLPDDVLDKDYQHKGRVDVTLLRLTLLFKPYEFYICGPGPMMETIVPALDEWGIPDEHINYEAFGPATISRAARKRPETDAPAESFKVTFSKSGQTETWDGSDDTLLDFAERHGIAMDSGCRAGGCGMCQTGIKSGEVIYTQTSDYDPDAGSCLTCVSKPSSDLEVDA